MEKLLIVHNEYSNLGGEDIAVIETYVVVGASEMVNNNFDMLKSLTKLSTYLKAFKGFERSYPPNPLKIVIIKREYTIAKKEKIDIILFLHL